MNAAPTRLQRLLRPGLAALSLMLMVLVPPSPAARAQAFDPTPLQFSDSAEEARFHRLAAELRCVMCQNQSLADSNAQIAHDLRREVLHLMRQGRSDAEVKQFLVARYGEFVLYRPPMQAGTWLLWFGPAVLLLIGGFALHRIVRARSARARASLHDEEQEW